MPSSLNWDKYMKEGRERAQEYVNADKVQQQVKGAQQEASDRKGQK